MYELIFVPLALITVFVSNIISTQDVNLSMFMYLANHLTPQECVKLTAYLYAEGLEPTAAKELEQDLPLDETCLSLLMTWSNSAGKEKSFLSIANCLRKIGHGKLAEWLSDTVFTQLSMELNNSFLQNTTTQRNTATVSSRSQKIQQTESCPYDRNVLFLLFDTFCMYFILMAIVTFVFYSLGLLVQTAKESQNILTSQKKRYKILEVGHLPQDLESEDEGDHFFVVAGCTWTSLKQNVVLHRLNSIGINHCHSFPSKLAVLLIKIFTPMVKQCNNIIK